MEVCPMIRKGKLVCLLEVLKGNAIITAKTVHKSRDCRAPGDGSHTSGGGVNQNAYVDFECYYCHEKGHYKSDYP